MASSAWAARPPVVAAAGATPQPATCAAQKILKTLWNAEKDADCTLVFEVLSGNMTCYGLCGHYGP